MRHMLHGAFIHSLLLAAVNSADVYIFNVEDRDGTLTALEEGGAGWCSEGMNAKGRLCSNARKVAELEARSARLLEFTLNNKGTYASGEGQPCFDPHHLVVFKGKGKAKKPAGRVSISLECR